MKLAQILGNGLLCLSLAVWMVGCGGGDSTDSGTGGGTSGPPAGVGDHGGAPGGHSEDGSHSHDDAGTDADGTDVEAGSATTE